MSVPATQRRRRTWDWQTRAQRNRSAADDEREPSAPAHDLSHRPPAYWLGDDAKEDIRKSLDPIEVIAKRHGCSVSDVIRLRYTRLGEAERFAL